MTNYLDPTTNPEALEVINLWGEQLQLVADGGFSIANFWVDFVQLNFTQILIIVVVMGLVGFGIYQYQKSRRKSKMLGS